jgi:hypothetical protein
MVISDHEKKTTAWHEAGHALVAKLLEKNSDPVHKVTIIPRGPALGLTQQLPKEDRLSMKGGILDGAPISGEELKQLAALPPRDELLARLVGGIASPLQGTANALNSLLSGMARALGAYHAQRAAEAPAEAAAPAEAPVAEAKEGDTVVIYLLRG